MISGFKASMNNLWEIGAHSAYFLTRLGNWVYALVELPICEATDGSDRSRGSASILQLTESPTLSVTQELKLVLPLSSSTVLSHLLSHNTR